MTAASAFLRDLSGLIEIQACLLILTFVLTNADESDVRTQLAWSIFLLPGWIGAAFWTPKHAGLMRQYFAATVTSIAMHAWIAGLGSWWNIGFDGYYIAFALCTVAFASARFVAIGRHGPRQVSLRRGEIIAVGVLMIVAIAVYRTPRSNDIDQFVLQQQDMILSGSLSPSPIGMDSLEVAEAMPRWRAHLWHLVPAVIADAADVPVDRVLKRTLTIPIALAVLCGLVFVLRQLSRRSTLVWIPIAAVLLPILLFYRSYTAFNYSFRITNNFCLDKDFCLFFLIPSVVYLAIGWQRGVRHFGWMLLAILPAIVKFHPMTIVYLIMLAPFATIGYARGIRFGDWDRKANLRTATLATGAGLLFVAVLLIGDAQSYHDRITEIIAMDYADYRNGRPLHHWSGFYGAIDGTGFQLDSTHWVAGRFQLQSTLITHCGLLLLAHLCGLVWAIRLAMTSHRRNTASIRRFLACASTLLLCWFLWFVSGYVLTRYPHLSGGVERLHWFAYLPALLMVIGGIDALRPDREAVQRWVNPIGAAVVYGGIVMSCWCYDRLQPTTLVAIRGLNSLLDYEIPAQRSRFDQINATLPELANRRPDYLQPQDRVLFLEPNPNLHFWLMKQGVYWKDPYAEAFALHERGDDFLADRNYFYGIFDRIGDLPGVGDWINRRGITLIVDEREGADAYVNELNRRYDLKLIRVQPGVWRRSKSGDLRIYRRPMPKSDNNVPVALLTSTKANA